MVAHWLIGLTADMKIEQSRHLLAKAFSLMESVVGMGIVGILTTAIYAALTAGFNTVRFAREDQRATQVLVQVMDQLRAVSWTPLTNGTSLPAQWVTAFNPEDTVVVHGAWNIQKLRRLGYATTIDVTDAP